MKRRLTAILAADVVGYSRLMGADEAGTLAALQAIRAEVFNPAISQYQGRLVKLTGDGMLIEFASVVDAVACAVEAQRAMRERNAGARPENRIDFRIGVNLGDVIVEADDIYGDGVNVAARLEAAAKPGGIAISQSVRDHVGNRLDLILEDLGEQRFKNIEQPVHVFAVFLESAGTPKKPGVQTRDRPSIAVLPFVNMSGDAEQEYFSDGITEDIITDLSKVSGLFIVARNASFIYKNKPAKPQEIGRELGVGHILEGSVRKAGGRVRITGQLVEVRNGGHIWAERFDRDLTDIFSIQDEITHAIVEQLKVKLLPQEKLSIERAPTDNVAAYTYYLRGRDFFYRHSKRYFELARRMFAKAAELDPQYALAYAGMADCDSWLLLTYQVEISPDEILATAEKALVLDGDLAEAHASRGAALIVSRKYEEANVEFERAILLDPNSFQAHFLYGRSSVLQGNFERAAQLFERASEIRPDDYQAPCLLIHIYRSLGKKVESDDAARRGASAAERELAAHPEDPRPGHLGIGALIHLGEKERAREWIARALAIEPDDPTTLYNACCGYSLLGDTDTALDLLERTIAQGGRGWLDWIEHDSDLTALHSYPRYQQVIELANQHQRDAT